jgi:hypothetical protein
VSEKQNALVALKEGGKQAEVRSEGVLEQEEISVVVRETKESESTVTDQVVVQKSVGSLGSRGSDSVQEGGEVPEESKLLQLEREESQQKCCAS